MEKLTVKQVAALYNVSPRTVNNWIAGGLITSERIDTPVGSYHLIHPNALKAFIKPRRGPKRAPIEKRLKTYERKLKRQMEAA